MSDLEEIVPTTEELLDSLVPAVQDVEMLLEFPREVVERYLYEREGYWERILTPEQRSAMVDRIRQVSFGLAWDLYSEEDISVMPSQVRGGAISLNVLLEYCNGIFRRLSRLIALIDRSPNQRLTRERVFVDFSLTRRSGPGSINWLMSHPRSHRFERAAPESTAAPNLKAMISQGSENPEQAYLPSEISETRVQIDYNTYENRFVRRFLTTMHSDINTLANLAEFQGEQKIRGQAEGLMRGVSELLQYDFLKYSSNATYIQPTSTLHRQPYYHQIYEMYTTYRRIFDFDWGNPLFKLPLRRSWLLYEYWCFFTVVEALKQLGFTL